MKKMLIYVILIVGLWSCNSKKEKASVAVKETASFNINPPLKGKRGRPTHYNIDNSKDTVLITKRGSFVSIPKNCFEDENGNEVKDNIDVEFTEYLNPADILLSGIPMVYMENDDTMDFQSAGMCQILAFKNDKLLQLRQNKSIKIGLRNMAQEENFNLYYFDTLKGNWIEKEQELIPLTSSRLPIVPVNLATINQDEIVSITIENSKVRPLYKMWHKSKFKIYGEQVISKPDSTIWWYDMSILPSKNPDIYNLTFTGVDGNANQCSQKMLVQPTIDSANFEAEMELFYKNMWRYVNELKKIESDLIQSKKEEAKIDSMWKVQSKIDSIMFAKQFVKDSIALIKALEYHKVAETRVEVMRSFSIKQMGIFNCDRFYKREIIATIQIGFKINNVRAKFENVFLINKYDNAVLTFMPIINERYSINFDSKKYTFVGTFGGNIYLTNIQLSNTPKSSYDLNIDLISVDELNKIMGS